MDRQLTFFDDEFNRDMEVKRHVRRTDPHTSHQAAQDLVRSGRLGSQCSAMLERLRQGPATSTELAGICLKYTSRLSDLRQKGYAVKATRVSEGCWSYQLEETRT